MKKLRNGAQIRSLLLGANVRHLIACIFLGPFLLSIMIMGGKAEKMKPKHDYFLFLVESSLRTFPNGESTKRMVVW